MDTINRLFLYGSSVSNYEPFDELHIRSVKDVGNGNIEACNEPDRSFYGLYAHSKNNDRWVSIADSPSKLELLELAEMFNVFSSFTLPLTTKFQL